MRKFSSGFSLIEIVLVIGIVGILIAGAVFILDPAQQLRKSRDATKKSDIKRVGQALENHRSDNSNYPRFGSVYGWAPLGSLTINTSSATYINPIPVAPGTSSIPCNGYVYAGNATVYTIFTKLENLDDLDATSAKDPPAFVPSGGFEGGGYRTYSWTGGSCANNIYNYWVNNP